MILTTRRGVQFLDPVRLPPRKYQGRAVNLLRRILIKMLQTTAMRY